MQQQTIAYAPFYKHFEKQLIQIILIMRFFRASFIDNNNKKPMGKLKNLVIQKFL